ncbi:hypothetical protein CXK86_19805 [Paenibacillus sp. BGI2013]|nr:hypothetical protein CXK86_19805 [Paenibacillus sp. BGI2013]
MTLLVVDTLVFVKYVRLAHKKNSALERQGIPLLVQRDILIAFLFVLCSVYMRFLVVIAPT